MGALTIPSTFQSPPPFFFLFFFWCVKPISLCRNHREHLHWNHRDWNDRKKVFEISGCQINLVFFFFLSKEIKRYEIYLSGKTAKCSRDVWEGKKRKTMEGNKEEKKKK
jgi:hypothetical protein